MNVPLAKAYDLERKGLEFYINSAVNAGNPLVKQTLFSLAQEEIKHMIKIDDIALKLEALGKWPEADMGSVHSDIEISIRKFFENTRKGAIEKNRDNAETIKKAMEFERKSYELYSDLERAAKTAQEKKFYGALMIQENEHYSALENVYYYLTKTGDWLGREESAVWSWMNS